jgi:iodothyronine deiodinase-like protein
MHRTYGDRADFLTVYIREAHPEDEWQMEPNPTEGVCYQQPRNLAERVAIANDFVRRFGWDVPLVVDPIENPADLVYAGWPERFYILDERGVLVFKGKPGPFGFKPQEVERWLSAHS